MTKSDTALLNPMSMTGRVVMVTGAGQGIGYAVCQMVCGLGGRVVAVDLNADGLAKLQAELGANRCHTVVGSVADADIVQTAVDQGIAAFGAIHGLVNNAGIIRPAMLHKMSMKEWTDVLDVHLTGTFLCTQAVAKTMIDRFKEGDDLRGSIVNISSDAGVQGTVGQINYSVAKAGVLGAAMSTARELARYNVRANSVAFGMVETPMTEVIRGEKFRDTYLSRLPLGRWSSPEEAAGPICFLLSDAASYVTGQRFSINGGNQMSL